MPLRVTYFAPLDAKRHDSRPLGARTVDTMQPSAAVYGGTLGKCARGVPPCGPRLFRPFVVVTRTWATLLRSGETRGLSGPFVVLTRTPRCSV